MAQLMQNKGKILAVDKTADKLEKLRENSHRLGVKIIDFMVADGKSFKSEPVDKILVDAPCSGTGVLNRNADARWQKSEKDLSRLAELQLALLENAARLLKPGGALVYSTCSIMPEENQETVEKFQKLHPEFKIADARIFVSPALVTGLGHLRTLPFLHKIDGAFAVRLEKK
jgi:16S rRNA (cytosine967-C5)-methyltransferase